MENSTLGTPKPPFEVDSLEKLHFNNDSKNIKKELTLPLSKCSDSDTYEIEDANDHTKCYCMKKDETEINRTGKNQEDGIPETTYSAKSCRSKRSKEINFEKEKCQNFGIKSVRDGYLTYNLDIVVKQEPDPDNIQYSAAVTTALFSSGEHQTEQNSAAVVKVEHTNVEEEVKSNGLPTLQDEVHSNGTDVPEKRTYTCEYCHKSFSKKSSLMSHWSTHTGETPYMCPFCEKRFSIRSNRNVHMLIHTGQRPHECEVCNKTFRQAGQLKQHMRIHKGEKPYVCKTCFKSFRNSSALVCHQRIHTGERPYNCDICSRSFTTSTSLKTHQVTHTGELLYDCPVCGRQFNRRNNLNVHIKRHDKIRSFTCPVCCNGFVMRAHLLKHVQRCHKVELATDDIKTTCSLPEENGGMTGIIDIKQENTT